jgi:phosphosulfolactate phosphohydrolase-like enzyme
MRAVITVVCALAVTGCAAWEGVNFGLSVANADTTLTISQGDGKTVLSAEQGGQKISGHFRR